MIRSLFAFAFALLLTVAYFMVYPNYGPPQVMRVSDHSQHSISDIVSDLKKARLVFVGEAHDDRGNHRAQLDVIRALKKAGVPVAVALEMFQKDNQPKLDEWVAGHLSESLFQKVYQENWDLPWDLYSPIFLYARDNKIPLVGLNVARWIPRQVAEEGFGSLDPEQIHKLPIAECNVDPEYESFIQRAYGAHGHSGGSFRHFCEAQLVWDTAMAWNLLAFVHEHPNAVVVVLAGNGHAWKPGIPTQIKRQSAIRYRVILPEVPGRVEITHVTTNEADYILLNSSDES